MARRIGVLAIQGDYDQHRRALLRAGVPDIVVDEVRTTEDLERVERLIIPGGESTTVGLLLQRFGLGPAIQARAEAGMPLWGTCMGLVMMATAIEGQDQYRLGLLDVTVRRNAFGAQVHSFEDSVTMVGLTDPIAGVFIRAPVVTHIGVGVEVLARYEGAIVAVRQGARLGTSFHPELTADTRLHQWFLEGLN